MLLQPSPRKWSFRMLVFAAWSSLVFGCGGSNADTSIETNATQLAENPAAANEPAPSLRLQSPDAATPESDNSELKRSSYPTDQGAKPNFPNELKN